MKSFLQELADVYCREHLSELHEMCFVFPGKRAGTFFARCLGNALYGRRKKHSVLLPRICTISEIVEQLCGKIVDNRIDMLFVLYNEYCRLQPSAEKKPDFDRFRSWGDIVLSDFNDVDMYLADAEKLFANLLDYNNIQTDYLTPKQKEILSQYFGATFADNETERFWKHMGKEKDRSDVKRKFLRIWETLYPLYKAFNKALAEEGMCYPGAAYREALTRLESDKDIPSVLRCRRIVFVGFNALSTAEFSIFAKLRDTLLPDGTPFADFYWDCTGPAMADKNNNANRFIDANRRNFPSLYRLSESDCGGYPSKMEVIGCPSNSIQAKEIHNILADMAQQKDAMRAIRDAKAAIVMPDGSLLMPLLYALPEKIEHCNVTMGIPLKMSAIASFVALTRRMQSRRRVKQGAVSFFHEDVTAVLMHPISGVLLGPERIDSFIAKILEHKMFLIPSSVLHEAFSERSILFEPADSKELLKHTEGAFHYPTTSYLYTLMTEFCTAVDNEECNEAMMRAQLERANAHIYIQKISQLDDTLHRRGIETSMSQIFRLTDRLLGSEQMHLEGQPLEGLQIMGVLETRGIDFDYVILPSMNEKIYPRKARKRSFIPNSLRIGYGLASTRYEESIFAYNFYRLISRAKEVYMLYDTRTGGLRSGDISRYILQLQYLYRPESMTMRTVDFDPIDSTHHPLSIRKTEEVQKQLQRYMIEDKDDPQRRVLSASALKNYITCPMKFYLKDLRRLGEADRVDEFISPIDQGNIFHETMEEIYQRMPMGEKKDSKGNFIIPADTIRGWLQHRDKDIEQIIKSCVDRNSAKQFKPSLDDPNVGYDVKLYSIVLKDFVRETLKADLKLAEKFGHIIYNASELKEEVGYPLPYGEEGSISVNMKYIIDRLDELGLKSPLLRISDYKTGKDKTEISKPEDVRKSDYGAIFQLMMYATLYSLKHKYYGPIRLDLYCTRNLHIRQWETAVKCGDKEIDDYREYSEQFRQIFDELLLEIFDCSVPFTCNTASCSFCDFNEICSTMH